LRCASVGGLFRITQHLAGDFVQFCAHLIGHISGGGQRQRVEQLADDDRFTGGMGACAASATSSASM
jgi:hypothetical protein